MELTTDLTNIQGILINLQKTTGTLNKIKYKGGNEEKILDVTVAIHKFLKTKNYIKNGSINTAFDNELKNLVLFLTINTEFKMQLDLEEYAHLINIMPQLSTCLLANIIIGLDLSKYYCDAFEKLPITLAEELLTEIVLCLKKCKPEVQLGNTYIFLQSIIKKLFICGKVCENTEKLISISSILLLNLTQLQLDHSKNWKHNDIYKHMGYSIMNILDLLLQCDTNNLALLVLIDKLLGGCSLIIKAVTIDVYCYWMEVELEDKILQNIIAEKAYLVIEKYSKYKPAKELIAMLSSIAKKPKSLNELIQQADVPTMISMVNKADDNQKHWFKALLNSQVLHVKQAINCINKWSYLCQAEDVIRLLNLSIHSKDTDAKNLVIRCAAALELPQLILVSTRHFHQNGVDNNLNEQPEQQLIILFNKLKDKCSSSKAEDLFCKELHLLLLQNPRIVLSYIFAECLKNSFYTQSLKDIWPSIKEIASVKDIGIDALNKEIRSNKLDEQNCKYYTELLNVLIEVKFYSIEFVVLNIILPVLHSSFVEENYDDLDIKLELLICLQESVVLKENTECLFNFLFQLMKGLRCKFLEFDGLKQGIVKKCVDYINKYIETNYICYTAKTFEAGIDPYVDFYQKKLLQRNENHCLLRCLCPNFTSDNHGEAIGYFIKILPMCVTPEWLSITSDLCYICGNDNTVELLTDFLILLCQLVNKETEANEINCMKSALKYYIQNFGMVVKEVIQPKLNNIQEDINLTKNICRLLKEIPSTEIKCESGLLLVNILSEKSLKLLADDKKFACLIVSINEPLICQILAQKIIK